MVLFRLDILGERRRLQDGQVALDFVVGHLTTVVFPFDMFVLDEALKDMVAEGVTDEELTQGKKSFALKFENNLANDRFVSNLLRTGLEVDRTLDFDAAQMKKVQSLTRAEIQRAITKHLAKAPFVEIMAGDLEKAAP